MDKQDLYLIDENVFKQIQDIKVKREDETKAYIEGMENGADIMMKAVRDFLAKKTESEG